jgi:hypothetical protein
MDQKTNIAVDNDLLSVLRSEGLERHFDVLAREEVSGAVHQEKKRRKIPAMAVPVASLSRLCPGLRT